MPAAGNFRKLEKAVLILITSVVVALVVSAVNSASVGTLKPIGQISLMPPSAQASILRAPLLSMSMFTQSAGIAPLVINVFVAGVIEFASVVVAPESLDS